MNVPVVRSAVEAERGRVMPRWTDAFEGGGLAHGSTSVVDGLEGAAMWLPPGVEPDVEGLMRIVEEMASERTSDLWSVLEQMSGFHPSEACWYLPLIGVDPAWQGRGLGALLMRQAKTRCDAEGLVAYLESSNPRNFSLYARHGFEVMGTILVGSSPVVMPMIRQPRTHLDH